MNGSGLLILNAPYQFERTLAPALAQLATLLAEPGAPPPRLDWLKPPACKTFDADRRGSKRIRQNDMEIALTALLGGHPRRYASKKLWLFDGRESLNRCRDGTRVT